MHKSPPGSPRLYQSNAILTASPGKLIQMMFEGCLRFVRSAKTGFQETQLTKRNELVHNNIQRAQAILAELQSNLNMEQGGEFAETMFKLYDFMYQKLQEANLNKILEPLASVESILTDLHQSWKEMLAQESSDPKGYSQSINKG